jgi:Nuclease-related domain
MAARRASPIKKKLLNQPGQSLDRRLDEAIIDRILAPGLVLLVLAVVCSMEWIGYLTKAPRQPWVYTAALCIAATGVVIYWRRQWPRLMSLKLGRDGERAVAECLDSRRDPHSRIFHDVPLDYGNCDHVVISTRGVYVIETKARSKPLFGSAVVSVHGDHVKVGGYKPDRNPISQARSCAAKIRRLLQSCTKTAVVVQSVVIFPGWSIEENIVPNSDVWVLNGREFSDRLAAMPEVFDKDQIAALSSHLIEHIRNVKLHFEGA